MATLTLTEKLDQLGARYDELTQQLSTSEVASDSARYQKVAKQHAELEEIVEKHREYKQLEKDLAGAHQMFVEAEDAEMKQMAHDEERELTARKEKAERELKLLLLPKDPLDEKSVILEIRAGTGGDEAALFAAELFRMYSRYAETQGWKVEVLESSPSSLGGLKEVVAAIQGQKVYSKLKYESGVHRVQRVPATETQGRIHTSAATVAVLPEADEIDLIGGERNGIIALQVRANDETMKAIVDLVNDHKTLLCLRAERDFLRLLHGHCNCPVGVLATIKGDKMKLRAQLFTDQSAAPREAEVEGVHNERQRLAVQLLNRLQAPASEQGYGLPD